jgi:hypothetical protein
LKTLHRSQRLRFGAAVLLFLLPGLAGHARVRHSDAWARENFTKAERMREALNGRPSKDRSRRDYQRVIDAYRRVYFGSPSSSKADASVVAVAELQVEMGRRFDDDQVLQMAVKQYEFLRREYPGSKYRFDALFTIGEIYKDDLGDRTKARATFEEFLRRYPRNRLADDATQAIAGLKAAPLEQTPALSSKKNVLPHQKTAAQIEAEKYQRAADLPGSLWLTTARATRKVRSTRSQWPITALRTTHSRTQTRTQRINLLPPGKRRGILRNLHIPNSHA